MSQLNARFNALREALNQRFVERYDEVEIAVVALLSGYHVVAVGPPGTGKSMLTRELTGAFTGARYFEHLMNKFTTPEELYGPLNIAALQEGSYERILDRTLAESHIAFLDEVFKSNSAILNANLQLMNERTYKHGKEIVPVPLISLFGASNELPEGEELGALFDRFQFRMTVDYIQEPGNFIRMLKMSDTGDIPELTLEDLSSAQAEVKTVEVPEALYETLYDIRSDLAMEGVIVSDRRFRQSLRALQAMAWIETRKAVTDDDFRILQHMFWTSPQDIKRVARVILSHTNPLELEADEIIDFAEEIQGQLTAALMDCKSKNENPKEKLTKQGIEWFTRCRQLSEQVKALEVKAAKLEKNSNKINQAKDRVLRVAKEVGRHTIGFETMDIKR
jgi:MoxR-like ATPase